MNRINLETCFPIRHDGPSHALPVLVDLNWFGRIMSSDNAGIIRSNALQTESEVVL